MARSAKLTIIGMVVIALAGVTALLLPQSSPQPSRDRKGADGSSTVSKADAWCTDPLPSAPSRSRLFRSSAWQDSLGDGLPDAFRLESTADRERFRHWFSFIAEMQYYYPGAEASREVQDCAGLIRYAFHEALRRHDGEWRRRFAAPVDFPIEDIEKYAYPRTPLGTALFRTRPGPFAPADVSGGAFREFADAETLVRYNTHRVGRRSEAARKGDLLVFRQPQQKQPYHTMIFLGGSEALPNAVADWIVYHTGQDGGQAGVIKKALFRVLCEHPEPRWRPVEENPNFLGFYRLNILR